MKTAIGVPMLALALAAPGLAAQRKKPEAPAPAAAPALKLAPAQLHALKARSIGPATMGGRVSDIAIDPQKPFTYYVGYATGGLMKTVNDGTTFDAVFEKESVHSIGAVAVAPSDSKWVWVGTGEANDRNSSGWGSGVYLSTDAGETWKNAGLAKSRAIARIVVSPTDPKTAWVAAVGDLWAPSGERGLYETTDAGASWTRVLSGPPKMADRVGCGDVVLDPSDPKTLYAALYARRRTPWSFAAGPNATDGEDVGGVFKTTDGGATWRKLAGGLPTAMGRIGLAVGGKNPKVVMAIVQSLEGGAAALMDVMSKHGGVFRSEDGGNTWTRPSRLDPRPFYFSQIRIDPENDQRVYVLGLTLHVSDDGGKSFREDLFEKAHPDNHALAIDAGHPSRLLIGNDGGVYESYDAGKSWRYPSNVAAGEYYRIALDSSKPFRICGGLQDNYSWVGPSATRTKDGITNSDWINLGGGDGFSCAFDPSDPDVVYFESQGANLVRLNLANGERKSLRPEAGEGQPAFRFHWNSPLVASRHEKGAFFLGGDRVLLLTERGTDWKAISPVLTTHDAEKVHAGGSGAETFGVIYTICESPLAAGLLWAGTDDGKLWMTDSGGERWSDLTSSLPSAARGHWISRVEAGHHDANVCYVAIDAHRTGSYAPLVYRTADKGRTWQSVAGDLPPDGPVKVIREGAKNPSVLCAGTEFGLFVSFDRGVSWTRLGELPTVAVDDIAIHPDALDMVVATHGRSLYVLDDVRALEAMTADLAKEDLHLFASPPAFGFYPMKGTIDEGGKGAFRGENPPEGALVTFWVREYGEPVTITIANGESQTVAKIKAPGTPGLNRVSWDLKPTKDYLAEYGGEGKDKLVRAGEYTVTLSRGKTKLKEKLTVAIAPGIETR